MEAAIRDTSDTYDVRVRWLPFLLRPEMPEGGVAKPAPEPGNPRVNPRLKAAGEEVGIDFTGKCGRYPYTLPSHALLEYAAHVDKGNQQNQLMEIMFKAYFTDGTYPDVAALVKMAEQVGLNGGEAKKVMTDKSKIAAAFEKSKNAKRDGVTGVPCFFMNGHRTFTGAQDSASFIRTFEVVAEKFPHKSAGGAT